MKLYVKYSLDKYELPIAVADSPKELAKMVGTTANVVSSSITHKRRGYAVVETKEDEK